jgi:hypothetical protein
MARGGSAGPQGSGSFHGREAFSPGRIVWQVLVIQVVLYVADAWLLTVFDHVLGVPLHSRDGRASVVLGQMFDHRMPSLHTSSGIVAIAAFYLSMIVCCSLAFAYLVGRSKRALDFSTTIAFVHLLCCTVLSGFPTSSLWWFMVCSAAVSMIVVSEVLSRRLELREISMQPPDVENPSADDDEDAVRPA